MDVPEDLKRWLNTQGLTKLQTIGLCAMGSLHTFFSDLKKQSVLLKIVPLALPISPNSSAKLAEARGELAAISHPALPKLLDVLIAEELGAFILIFEDFRQNEATPLLEANADEKKKIRWMASLVKALDCLHQSHVVLNCAPTDLFFVVGGEVALADYGLAELSLLPFVPLQERLALNIDEYLAPEYSGNARRADHRKGDLWTLGRVLLEMFTNTRLLAGAKTERERKFMKQEIDAKLPSIKTEYARSMVQ